MNKLIDVLPYLSLASFPAYILYLFLCSPRLETRISKQVESSLKQFKEKRGKVKAWRISLLYESYKNDYDLSPQMHYCIEVNMGWMLAPRWRTLMVSQVKNPKEMLSKFNLSKLGRLPKSLQIKNHIHTPGSRFAWRSGFLLITAFPFGIEVMRLLAFS